jgi:hypothetical protein
MLQSVNESFSRSLKEVCHINLNQKFHFSGNDLYRKYAYMFYLEIIVERDVRSVSILLRIADAEL